MRVIAEQPPLHATARASELDWLRLAAVVLVLVVHTAQIFSPFESWHIASPDRSRALGLFTALTAPWIMPLFTLVAGAGAWYFLQRHDARTFFRSRVLRLLPPLVAGTLLLVPPQVYYRRLYRGEFDGTFLEFYPRFFDGVYPAGNFSYGHLWFIAYLFLYLVAALPVFAFLSGPRGGALLTRMTRACDGRGAILLGAIPFAAGQLLFRAHYTQTTGAIVGDWATHALLFTALIIGYALYAERRLLAAVDRDWPIALVPALLPWIVLAPFVLAGDVYARLPAEPGPWYLLFWSAFSLTSWASLVAVLGAARRWLGRSTPFLQRWRHSAYAIYVLHQTIVVWVAFRVVGWPLGIAARFALIAALSLAATLALIRVLGRVPGVGVLLGVQPRAADRTGSGSFA